MADFSFIAIVLFLSISHLSRCDEHFFVSQSLINFIYKNFDIDAFDHTEFLFDNDETKSEDVKAQTYHDLLQTLTKYNVTTLVNHNHSYSLKRSTSWSAFLSNNPYKRSDFNVSGERKQFPVRFPTLYYISITTLTPTKVSQFLQNRSSISLANDIWIVVLDTPYRSKYNSGEPLLKDVDNLIPNLELDSQLFIIIPMSTNCNCFSVYEAYKVLNISKKTLHDHSVVESFN